MAHANPYAPGQVETLEQARNELVKLADTVKQIIDNQKLVQRDDGCLMDCVVVPHTLSDEVVRMIGHFELVGAYAARPYQKGQVVTYQERMYVCAAAHHGGAVMDMAQWRLLGKAGCNDLQKLMDNKLLWMAQNGAALPYDAKIEYAEGAVVVKDGELQKKQGASWVSAANKGYNLDYFVSGKSYPLHAEIMLENGDIVKSTVANNIINPNVDMAGWEVFSGKKFNEDLKKEISKRAYTVKSIADLKAINSNVGIVAVVGSYYDDTSGLGGGVFVADKSDKSSSDNGGTVIVSADGTRWRRVDIIQNLSLADFGGTAGMDNFAAAANNADYLNLPSFKTRADFVSAAAGLKWLPNGHSVVAQGLVYQRQSESRYIPDLPGWVPVSESFGHFDGNYVEPSELSSAMTEYVVLDGLRINITTVKNIRPGTLRKDYSAALESDGSVRRNSLREYAKRANRPMILTDADMFTAPNGASWETSDYGKATGLQIRDGVLIKDWADGDLRSSAVIMLRTGKLVEALRTDGISGQQWIERGAQWSVCFGPTLIKDGNITAGLNSATLSARAAMGQNASGDVIFIHIEGVSGSYGATLQKVAEIMKERGCIFAYNLDGGGSAQLWWKDAYACLSSDNDFQTERKVGGLIEINADITGDFDTGWQQISTIPEITAVDASLGVPAVSYRQQGRKIEVRLNMAGPFNQGYTKAVTSERIPLRFTAVNFRPMRGVLIGADAVPGHFYAGGYLTATSSGSTPYMYGRAEWDARNIG